MKIIRKRIKGIDEDVPAKWVMNGPLKELDYGKWGMERLTSDKELSSSNVDDRRTKIDTGLLDEPKTTSTSPDKISDIVLPTAEPLKPLSDALSRSMRSPQRSERMMPGPYEKRWHRAVAADKAKGLDEDAPTNSAGSGNIAGLGVGAAGEPGISPRVQKKIQRKNRVEADTQGAVLGMWRRKTPQIAEGTEGVSIKSFVVEKGKFAGHDTFIVPSNMFHTARMQKKKGAHWTKYVGSGVHAEAIRQHAKANYGKPIILQDENTGAMCYARYGKKDNTLSEAPLFTRIGKKTKFNRETGRKFREPLSNNKIGKVDKDHDLYHKDEIDGLSDRKTGKSSYHVVHRDSGKVTTTVYGKRNPKAKSFEISTTDSTGTGPKAHKVYRKILQSGHSTSMVGASHSVGGQKIWQKLSSMRGVAVHGWRAGKPVNLDPKDSDETHITDREMNRVGDAAAKDIYNTKLVASLHARKTV